MAMSIRKRRALTRMKVRRFLSRIRSATTYGEVAKAVGVKSPMALGQILRGIVNDNPEDKKLTKKVKAA